MAGAALRPSELSDTILLSTSTEGGSGCAFSRLCCSYRLRSWSDGRPKAASARSENRIYTLRQNDVVRAPGAATRCTASVEGGSKNLFCRRSPEGRYQVVFCTDSIIVWKNGNPDKPAFSARWQR